MNQIDQSTQSLTLGEFIACAFTVPIATIILTTYWIDVFGLPINSPILLFVLVLETSVGSIWLRRKSWPVHAPINYKKLAGFLCVMVGLLAYMFLLAGPWVLPPTSSSDMVLHLNLISYIATHHQLIHNTNATQYLGEMIAYFPGGHLLVALASVWLNVSPIRLLFPVLASLVVIKVGFVYLIILRVLPPSRRNPAIAVAGTALLLMAWIHFVVPFTIHFYYSDVISETFSIAMLWALTKFYQKPSKSILFFWGLCGAAVSLTFPVWLPVPAISLMLIIVLDRVSTKRAKIHQIVIAFMPVVLAWLAYLINYVESYQKLMINYEGSEVTPSPWIYGPWFLILASLGLIIAFRQQRVLPIMLTFGWAILQPIILLFGAVNHINSLYVVYKSVHILLYPLAVTAALGLDSLWHSISRRFNFVIQKTLNQLSAALPVLVIIAALNWGLPQSAWTISVTPAIYQVGKWAKTNLPTGCVDYAVEYWVTAFYLHINALGNPSLSSRSDQIVGDPNVPYGTRFHLTDTGLLPFVIVENALLPNQPVNSRVLYKVDNVAVLQRLEASSCASDVVPLDKAIFTQPLIVLPWPFH